MSDRVPQPWEVWHARFDFPEGRGYKFRPVIVLAARADGSLVAMVTSSSNKLSLAHDYPLREWGAAGLDKPSIARFDRIAEIPPGYLGMAGRIGRLADSDIAAIKAILAEITR
ncbi:type II toxin-antitoxin system PemK/MazF family toxin [Curtanaerobium respiraculi]|uniref:type II toxin-antitoxin system PemK/MazF family toxin n=1 Tax=Curtanaerobium respiraculi TaxID=2949669 RepID=UPI0024B3C630|nr:type II toxin-antitoxin system PemK/MazF family toxin [Curtanaerobium respiraculi]